MARRFGVFVLAFAFTLPSCSGPSASADQTGTTPVGSAQVTAATGWSTPRSRTFELTYQSVVSDIPAGTKSLQVWIPRPRTQPGTQEVSRSDLAPIASATVTEGGDRSGGVSFWCVTVKDPPSSVTFTATHVVTRHEQVNNYFRGAGQAALTAEQRQQMANCLGADALVPTTGRVEQLALSIDPGEKNGVNLARAIYDQVLARMEYKKTGTGWGRGDTLWACDSGYGNCTDFHSMFMSFARARGIPARFHMGIPLPPEHGSGTIPGYHCWAEFYVSELGWVPVDISEADKHPELAQYYFGALTEDRVAFTMGRDLDLDPAPASGRQNFFIYPIVEADGKPLQEKHTFSYRDL